ncbi:hypothetical protein AWB74_08172 [Caballeronia arvi]|uniref:Uncharacterized protein n=1 Tax=Caballeronia arvi TaxID=1777135 RepID=A0A158L4F3_9BURK|nr:hypothetical protein [Caballeronia arvi]SAL87571.1 hypothetical protein AWB74_08172 [Caballeronia arvi]
MESVQPNLQRTGYLMAVERMRSLVLKDEAAKRSQIRDEILFLIDVVDASGPPSLIVQSALNVARSHAVLGKPMRALSRVETLLIENQ